MENHPKKLESPIGRAGEPAFCRYKNNVLQNIFYTSYSMGLRLGEGIKLTVGDIDTTNMRVHTRNAKGNKDSLEILRSFWLTHRHPDFICPRSKKKNQKCSPR